MSALHERVFFSGPTPCLPETIAAPYGSGHDHLSDELSLCRLLFSRLPALRAMCDRTELLTTSRAEMTVRAQAEAQLQKTQLRMNTLRTAIAARIAATARNTLLPLPALAARFTLDEAAQDILKLLVAVELEPELLLAAGDGQPTGGPNFLVPQLLYELCAAPAGPPRSQWLAHLIGPQSLIEQRLVLRNDESTPLFPFGAAPLRLHPQVLAFILQRPGELDPVLASCATYSPAPDPTALSSGEQRLGLALADDAQGHCLWLIGPPRYGGRELARRLCGVRGRDILELDLGAFLDEPVTQRVRILRELSLVQRLLRAVLIVQCTSDLNEPHVRAAVLRCLRRQDTQAGGPVILLTEHASPEISSVLGAAVCHQLPAPQQESRAVAWRAASRGLNLPISDPQIRLISAQFPLGEREIGDVLKSVQRVCARNEIPSYEVLRHAATQRLRGRLGQYSSLVTTPFGWEDLILPPEELSRLEDLVNSQKHRDKVLTTWQMATKVPYGNGLAALLSGAPGTGKTMAASVIANTLGRELHRVDLSRVVDKYIGETEKRLGAIFDAASEAHAVLLFDEADGLFTRRTAVSSSNDRYANLETGFLLQRMEQHTGITILTTNRLKNIDEAFLRRLQFRIEFPFPDEEARAQIWQSCFTDKLPLADDIDCLYLGQKYELAGGHIKASVLRAAYHAAAAGQPLSLDMLCMAADAEYQNLGKLEV